MLTVTDYRGHRQTQFTTIYACKEVKERRHWNAEWYKHSLSALIQCSQQLVDDLWVHIHELWCWRRRLHYLWYCSYSIRDHL